MPRLIHCVGRRKIAVVINEAGQVCLDLFLGAKPLARLVLPSDQADALQQAIRDALREAS